MVKPLISYILPCYNVAGYIERCLSSILNQTYENIEIICVDDASPDETQSIIKKYMVSDKRVKLEINSSNRGVSSARNLGIKNSNGEFVAILDPDDWIEKTRTEELVNIALLSGVDIVGDDILNDYDCNSRKNSLQFGLKKSKLVGLEDFLFNNIPSVRNTKRYGLIKPLIKRELITANAIYYNQDCNFSEDFEFYSRLLSAGAKLLVVPYLGYHYIKRESSATTSPKITKLRKIRKLNKNLYNNNENSDQKALLSKRQILINKIALFNYKLHRGNKLYFILTNPCFAVCLSILTFNFMWTFVVWKKL